MLRRTLRLPLLGFVLSSILLPFLIAAAPVKAQIPTFVPAARYYGSVFVNGLPAAPDSTVTAQGLSGGICGIGSVFTSGSYSVDIQSFGACYGPLYFSVNGQQADQTSSVPSASPSGAVMLNLTVSSGYFYGPSYVAQPLGSSYGPPSYVAQPLGSSYGPSSYVAQPLGSSYGPSYATQSYTYSPSSILPESVQPQQPSSSYSSATTSIAGAGSTVTYAPGWNIVAGAPGAAIVGATGSLFTFQPGDTGYETVAASTPLRAGFGYWELFATASAVTMPYASLTSITRNVPPGQIALIGNPFARSATVSGASTVYTYDPVRGYVVTTTLRPGQGAWAVSATGSIVINAGCC